MKKYKVKKRNKSFKWYNLEDLFNKKFKFMLLKEKMKNDEIEWFDKWYAYFKY